MRSILFLGAKEVGLGCLRHLLEHAAHLGVVVAGVVLARSRNPALACADQIAALAAAHGVPVLHDLPDDHPPVDHLISVQYHAVLSAAQLALAGTRAINLHMAPLPEYRGANQFTFAILNGDTEFGATLHEMLPKVDAGPILAEARFPLPADWTVKQLYDHTVAQSIQLFKDSIADILDGRAVPIDQRTARPDAPRHFYRKSDVAGLKALDPAWPLEKIDRYARAFDMPGFEPAYFEYGGHRLYVRRGY